MQEQYPGEQLRLFRAFDGYVEHFYLTDSFKALNPYFTTDLRNDTDALINVIFTKDFYLANEKSFANQGRNS